MLSRLGMALGALGLTGGLALGTPATRKTSQLG